MALKPVRPSELVIFMTQHGVTSKTEAKKLLEEARRNHLEAQLRAFEDQVHDVKLEGLDDLIHAANEGNYGHPSSERKQAAAKFARRVIDKLNRMAKSG